jgi:hypothetical protein
MLILSIVLLGIGCVACNNKVNTDKKVIVNDTMELHEEINANEAPQVHAKNNTIKYSTIKNKIDSYMTKFSANLTNTVLDNNDKKSSIVVHTGTIDLTSTEGNEGKQYKDSNGKILRYSISQFGEMGSIQYEYYKINKDITYVTVLESIYSYPMNLGIDIDILKTILNEYVITNNKTYYLDNYEKKLIEIKSSDNKLPFNNFQDLNKRFIETKE